MQRKSCSSPTVLPLAQCSEISNGRLTPTVMGRATSPPRSASPPPSLGSAKRQLSSGSYSSYSSIQSVPTKPVVQTKRNSSSSTSSNNNNNSSSGMFGKLLAVMVMTIMFVSGCKITQQKNDVLLKELQDEQATLIQARNRLQHVVSELRGSEHQLQGHLESNKRRLQEYDDLEPQRLQGQMAIHQIKQIQNSAKQEVLQLFGEGPYYVEFTLNFPGQTESKYFTVELASLDDMPASVLTFLQQIHHKLWDNASFAHNAPHVNMARPVSTNIDTMVEHNIQHTPFAEYSMEHTPYTLGFAGYPAGPEFYINKQDNTQTHGPNNHREDGHYEPAFATIIIGRDTINDMDDLPLSEEPAYDIVNPVQILSARLEKDIKSVHGGQEWLEQQPQQQQDVATTE